MSFKYRYRREYYDDSYLVDGCNALGEQGWSLVGPPVWVPGDDRERAVGTWRCFFRRTVSRRELVREVFSLKPQEAQP